MADKFVESLLKQKGYDSSEVNLLESPLQLEGLLHLKTTADSGSSYSEGAYIRGVQDYIAAGDDAVMIDVLGALGSGGTHDHALVVAGYTTGDSGRLEWLRVSNTEFDYKGQEIYHAGNLDISDLGGVPASRTLTAGSGLTGGGDLSANRTFNVGVGDGISVTADAVAVDSTVVRTTGVNQTIGGAKIFSNTLQVGSGAEYSLLTNLGELILINGTDDPYVDFRDALAGNSLQLLSDPSAGLLYRKVTAGTYKIWDEGNDGSGSGMDADKLDSFHASQFLRSDEADSSSASITFTDTSGKILGFDNDTYQITVHDGTGDFNIKANVSISDQYVVSGQSAGKLHLYTVGEGFEFSIFGHNGTTTTAGAAVSYDWAWRFNESGLYRSTNPGLGGGVSNALPAIGNDGRIYPDGGTMTSGRVPYIHSSGYLTGDSGLAYSSGTLTATNLAGAGAGITGVVHTTGNETVAGVKTFTSAPVISAAQPTIIFDETDYTSVKWSPRQAGGDFYLAQLDADSLFVKNVFVVKEEASSGLMTLDNGIVTVSGTVSATSLSIAVGEGLEVIGNNDYFGAAADARIIRAVDTNGTSGAVDGGIVFGGYTTTDTVFEEWLVMRNGTFTWKGSEVWHAGNDGAASGLDSDLLDGQHGSYYLAASAYTAADVLSKLLTVDGAGSGLDADLLDGLSSASYVQTTGNQTVAGIKTLTDHLNVSDKWLRVLHTGGATAWNIVNTSGVLHLGRGTDTVYSYTPDFYFYFGGGAYFGGTSPGDPGAGVVKAKNGMYVGSDVVWHAGNDGAASGLDSDLLDGQHGSYYLAWSNFTGVPSTFTPSAHTHVISDTTGLQTALDSKLNSSSYTAADVLAKLLTVDGAASGLDADLLDGNSSAYYLASASYTAADVLAKLLTVDGSGSGIDSDLLDGLSSASFVQTAGNQSIAGTKTFTSDPVISTTQPAIYFDETDYSSVVWSPRQSGGDFYLAQVDAAFSFIKNVLVVKEEASSGLMTLDDGIVDISGVIELNDPVDVTLTSTGNAVQIGAYGSPNLVFDSNEMQARNNGAASSFLLNVLGGDVVIGASGTTTTLSATAVSIPNGVLSLAGVSDTTSVPTKVALETGNDNIVRWQDPDVFANNLKVRNRYFKLPNTEASAQWVKIGTFTAPQAGQALKIDMVLHSGYNADNTQDVNIYLFFKTSNGSVVDANGFAGNSWHYVVGNNAWDFESTWVANASGVSATAFDLFMYLPVYTSNSFYNVYFSDDSTAWAHVGGLGQSDPGGGSATVCVSESVFDIKASSVKSNGYTVWHAGNDGTGSGLEADILDGQHGSYYLAWANFTGVPSTFTPSTHSHVISDTTGLQTALDSKLAASSYTAADVLAKLLTVDGVGSGVDADLLDGLSSASFVQTTGNQTVSGIKTFTSAPVIESTQPTLIFDETDTTDDNFKFVLSTSSFYLQEIDNAFGSASTVMRWFHGGGLSIGDGASDPGDGNVRIAGSLSTASLSIAVGEGLEIVGDNDYFSAATDARIIRAIDANGTSGAVDGGIVFGGYTTTDAQFEEWLVMRNSTFTWKGSTVWHAGNDGASSGLDADLLDGQHGGYYLSASSYTAADVLAKLLTVDGSGSGLDADLLDGNSSAYFLPASTYTASDILTKIKTVDGSGSGLDADLLDGISSASFVQITGAQTVAGIKTLTDHLNVSDKWVRVLNTSGTTAWNIVNASGVMHLGRGTDTVYSYTPDFYFYYGGGAYFGGTSPGDPGAGIVKAKNGMYVGSDVVWHAGNDGAASGLDADLLDGQHGSYYLAWANFTGVPSTFTPSTHSHVISDTTGLQTALDAKLNSSSYTAADVLAKLLTVDGASSGLDADLLDGNSSAYFLAAASYTAADVLAKLLTVDGASSGLDSDLLDGSQRDTAYNSFGNGTIPLRSSNGYLYSNYFNMTANTTTGAATKVAVETGADGFLRWQTPEVLLDGTTRWEKHYLLPNTTSTAQWVKLGTFTAAQSGYHIVIEMQLGSGYNAANTQDSWQKVYFKTSNGTSVDANGFAGNGRYWSEGYNISDLTPKWKANAAGTAAASYDLYVFLSTYTNRSFYRVAMSPGATWTHTGTLGQADPGAGSSTVCVASRHVQLNASNIALSGTLLPVTDSTYDIGSSGVRFSTIYSDTLNSTNVISSFCRINAANGNGVRFWDSDSYKIWMSSATDGTWGGRLDSTSDYNMYFRMSGGTNRGFVFTNNTTPVAQIESTGRIHSASGGGIRLLSMTMDLTSTDHAFQLGATAGNNLRMDSNKVQAVNNGGGQTLLLNNAGGDIGLGAAAYLVGASGFLSLGSYTIPDAPLMLTGHTSGLQLHGVSTTTNQDITWHLESAGKAILILEADANSGAEDNVPYIYFSQDAGGVTGFVGLQGQNNSPLDVAVTNADTNGMMLGTNTNYSVQIVRNNVMAMKFNSGQTVTFNDIDPNSAGTFALGNDTNYYASVHSESVRLNGENKLEFDEDSALGGFTTNVTFLSSVADLALGCNSSNNGTGDLKFGHGHTTPGGATWETLMHIRNDGRVSAGFENPTLDFELIGEMRIRNAEAHASSGIYFGTHGASATDYSQMIHFSDRNSNAYGHSIIAAGQADPVFDGVTFSDVEGDYMYVIRHNASTAGAVQMSFARAFDSVGFGNAQPNTDYQISSTGANAGNVLNNIALRNMAVPVVGQGTSLSFTGRSNTSNSNEDTFAKLWSTVSKLGSADFEGDFNISIGVDDTEHHAVRWNHHGNQILREALGNPVASELTSDGYTNVSDRAAIYVKNEKFVIAYNQGGSVYYLVINLDGSNTTWSVSTTAP